MSEPLRYAIKQYAVILAVSLAAALLLAAGGIMRVWDTFFVDSCVNYRVLKSSQARSPYVATIDLTDTGIEALDEQLDTRSAFADLIDVLYESNISAAALDFMFFHEKSNDAGFADAVKNAGHAVIASLAVEKNQMGSMYRGLNEDEKQLMRKHIWRIKVLHEGKIPEAETILMPQPVIGNAAAQIAHINANPDEDGIYRKVPLLYKWEDGFIPSLALAAAVLHLGIPIESIKLKAGAYLALPLDEYDVIRIPVDEHGRMLIPYCQNYKNDTSRFPFHTIAGAKNDPEVFDDVFTSLNGRIALVSEISTSQKDFGPTSFERLYPLSGVHAEVISSILEWHNTRSFIRQSSLTFKILTVLLLLFAGFICFRINRERIFHLGFAISILIFTGVSALRWYTAAILPWAALPMTLFIFLWAGTFFTRLLRRYREQLLMQSALSRYFPHALADRIMRERKTLLIPAYKELSILFSDISGFTKWSSDKSPELVHGFLNEYLESMAEIIFSYGGTIDKFMGDGILAFFGDPIDLPNHCEQCILAAIAMQEKIKLLAEKWKPLADIDLKVRMGINTGKVIVGDLGSKTRIEYTVIGSAVNLAQRMEASAPAGGILVTADAREKAGGGFAFTEKKDIRVKGYTEAIEAYLVACP